MNAQKRFCLGELPATLVLQLKRFQLDYETMTNIKINSRCAFPPTLDLEPYTKAGLEARAAGRPPTSPELYELAGVLVHTGTSDFGHYFSYVRAREAGRAWHTFNDTAVSLFDETQIEETCYGGDRPLPPGVAAGRAAEKVQNGFLLFYRRAPAPSTSGSGRKQHRRSGSAPPAGLRYSIGASPADFSPPLAGVDPAATPPAGTLAPTPFSWSPQPSPEVAGVAVDAAAVDLDVLRLPVSLSAAATPTTPLYAPATPTRIGVHASTPPAASPAAAAAAAAAAAPSTPPLLGSYSTPPLLGNFTAAAPAASPGAFGGGAALGVAISAGEAAKRAIVSSVHVANAQLLLRQHVYDPAYIHFLLSLLQIGFRSRTHARTRSSAADEAIVLPPADGPSAAMGGGAAESSRGAHSRSLVSIYKAASRADETEAYKALPPPPPPRPSPLLPPFLPPLPPPSTEGAAACVGGGGEGGSGGGGEGGESEPPSAGWWALPPPFDTSLRLQLVQLCGRFFFEHLIRLSPSLLEPHLSADRGWLTHLEGACDAHLPSALWMLHALLARSPPLSPSAEPPSATSPPPAASLGATSPDPPPTPATCTGGALSSGCAANGDPSSPAEAGAGTAAAAAATLAPAPDPSLAASPAASLPSSAVQPPGGDSSAAAGDGGAAAAGSEGGGGSAGGCWLLSALFDCQSAIARTVVVSFISRLVRRVAAAELAAAADGKLLPSGHVGTFSRGLLQVALPHAAVHWGDAMPLCELIRTIILLPPPLGTHVAHLWRANGGLPTLAAYIIGEAAIQMPEHLGEPLTPFPRPQRGEDPQRTTASSTNSEGAPAILDAIAFLLELPQESPSPAASGEPPTTAAAAAAAAASAPSEHAAATPAAAAIPSSDRGSAYYEGRETSWGALSSNEASIDSRRRLSTMGEPPSAPTDPLSAPPPPPAPDPVAAVVEGSETATSVGVGSTAASWLERCAPGGSPSGGAKSGALLVVEAVPVGEAAHPLSPQPSPQPSGPPHGSPPLELAATEATSIIALPPLSGYPPEQTPPPPPLPSAALLPPPADLVASAAFLTTAVAACLRAGGEGTEALYHSIELCCVGSSERSAPVLQATIAGMRSEPEAAAASHAQLLVRLLTKLDDELLPLRCSMAIRRPHGLLGLLLELIAATPPEKADEQLPSPPPPQSGGGGGGFGGGSGASGGSGSGGSGFSDWARCYMCLRVLLDLSAASTQIAQWLEDVLSAEEIETALKWLKEATRSPALGKVVERSRFLGVARRRAGYERTDEQQAALDQLKAIQRARKSRGLR